MPDVPSIKGTALEAVVEDVRRLLGAGSVSRDALEARLEPADLELLEQKILPGVWYPNACHRRMTELLRDVEGGGTDEYVVRRGARTAERFLEAGLYHQIQRALASAGDEGGQDLEGVRRAVRLFMTLAGTVYSFGSWSLESDAAAPSRLRVEVRDAAHFTEMNRLTVLGFIQTFGQRLSDPPVRVTPVRRAPDHVAYVMDFGPGHSL
jgi:hypothetical protein